MTVEFTSTEEGKTVVTGTQADLGTVESVQQGVPFIKLSSEVTRDLSKDQGWEKVENRKYQLNPDLVESITGSQIVVRYPPDPYPERDDTPDDPMDDDDVRWPEDP